MDENSEAKVTECPDCGATEFEKRNGERYCKRCGLVIED
jgi:transcription initiation factor TFIIIB Brf1 subunit/transcription initiation factor TFIIB